MGHPAPWVFPLPDGHGVVKPLPQRPVAGLGLVRRRHLKVRQRADRRLAAGIKQGLPMGPVIEEEGLPLIAGTEVAPQQGEHSVFGPDLPAQHAAQLGEADKALELVGLAVKVTDGGGHRVQRLVREISQETGPLPQQLDHQAVEVDLLVRQTGEIPLSQQLCCKGRTLYDFSEHSVGALPICGDRPGGKQCGEGVLLQADGGGDLLAGVAFKDAGEEALEASVVIIDQIVHRWFLRRCQTRTAVPPPAVPAGAAPRRSGSAAESRG